MRAELAAWSWPRGVSWSSARIAPLFEPLSSAALLEAQAIEVQKKIKAYQTSDLSRRRRTTHAWLTMHAGEEISEAGSTPGSIPEFAQWYWPFAGGGHAMHQGSDPLHPELLTY